MFHELEEKASNNTVNVTKPTNRSKLVGGTVCKYWLENRCRKGELCEFLHENIKEKLPECTYGINCTRQFECPFKHTRKVVQDCINYESGYCKDGKNCKQNHKERILCINYLLGFCPDGPKCKFYHLKSMIHPTQDNKLYILKK